MSMVLTFDFNIHTSFYLRGVLFLSCTGKSKSHHQSLFLSFSPKGQVLPIVC